MTLANYIAYVINGMFSIHLCHRCIENMPLVATLAIESIAKFGNYRNSVIKRALD